MLNRAFCFFWVFSFFGHFLHAENLKKFKKVNLSANRGWDFGVSPISFFEFFVNTKKT